MKFVEWHEIKFRESTEEEKKEYEDFFGVQIDEMFDCILPEDGEEVLIATKYGTTTDTYCSDNYGGDFEYYDANEVLAWAKMPTYNNDNDNDNSFALDIFNNIQDVMKKLWDKYESDTYNVPKPDYLSAYALIEALKTEYE